MDTEKHFLRLRISFIVFGILMLSLVVYAYRETGIGGGLGPGVCFLLIMLFAVKAYKKAREIAKEDANNLSKVNPLEFVGGIKTIFLVSIFGTLIMVASIIIFSEKPINF